MHWLHLKIKLTCSLTWQTDHCTPWRKCLSQALLKPSMCLLFDKLPEWAPNKHGYVDCTTTCMAHWQSTCAQLSSLYLSSTLSVTYVLNFPYCKWWKAGRGLDTRLVTPQRNHSTHKSYADYSHYGTFIANKGQGSNLSCQQTFYGYDQLCGRLLAV